jgi:hypothetical protein
MGRAIICREMGWTWQEYDEQPTSMIAHLIAMMRAENQAARKKNTL